MVYDSWYTGTTFIAQTIDFMLLPLRAGRTAANNLYIITWSLIAIKTIGADFVFGYIQAIDGEKVPGKLCVFVWECMCLC